MHIPNRMKRACCTLLTACLLGIPFTEAQANAIVQNLGFSLISDDTVSHAVTLEFDKFDTAGGTLTSVEIQLTSLSWNVYVGVSGTPDPTNTEPATHEATVTALQSMTSTHFNPDSNILNHFSAECTTTAGVPCNDSTGPFNLGFGSASRNPVALSQYLGIGTFDVDVSLDTTLVVTTSGAPGASSTGNSSVTATGGVAITYNFDTPSAAPEPGSLALLGLGLAGLGLFRRRLN